MITDLPLQSMVVADLSHGGGAAECVRILSLLGAEIWRHKDPKLSDRAEHGIVVVTDVPLSGRRADPDLGQRGRVIVSVSPWGLGGFPENTLQTVPSWAPVSQTAATALTGAHAAVVALAAVRASRARETHLLVEISQQEVLASCLGEALPRAMCASLARVSHQAPEQRTVVLPCADGYAGLYLPTAVHRRDAMAMAGIDGDIEGVNELPRLLDGWLRRHSRTEVFHTGQLWRLPFVPVLRPHEALAGGQRTVEVERALEACCARSPFRFTSEASSQNRPLVPGPLPLSDIRVLDLGVVWAGPYCGRLLASLGAQVIKVEGPSYPDGTRRPAGACPGLFADLNRGKTSLVLDLSRAAGRDLFLRLVPAVDVVVENFSRRVMPNLGLDFATVSQTNPSVIMLSMPAFDSTGPWANYVAYGSGLELVAGLAFWPAGQAPAPAPVPYLDFLSGAYGAAAVLAAIIARDTAGSGRRIELPQHEVALQLTPAAAKSDWPSRVPAMDVAAALADAQLVRRGLFAKPDAKGVLRHHYARPPWRLHGLARQREQAAPEFGAGTVQVLRRLAGVSPAEVDRLARAGVVVSRSRDSGRKR